MEKWVITDGLTAPGWRLNRHIFPTSFSQRHDTRQIRCRQVGCGPAKTLKRRFNMKNKMSVLIAGLLAALLVVGIVGATNAYAQGPSSDRFHGRGPGGGRGLGLEGLQVAAEALNMTTDELINALRSGKTLEEIANEAGVEYQAVLDAIQAARATELRDRIQQALDAGTITQEHADWLFEGLDKGFLGGPGDFGFGGRHGFGIGPGPNQTPTAPTAEPTQQSGG
jgi:hypothetical protein